MSLKTWNQGKKMCLVHCSILQLFDLHQSKADKWTFCSLNLDPLLQCILLSGAQPFLSIHWRERWWVLWYGIQQEKSRWPKGAVPLHCVKQWERDSQLLRLCRNGSTKLMMRSLLTTQRTFSWQWVGLVALFSHVSTRNSTHTSLQDSVTYSDFVNKELVQFAKYDESLATWTTCCDELEATTRIIRDRIRS